MRMATAATATAPAAKITYRKTRQGEWVAFGPVSAMPDLRNTSLIDVTRKDGGTDRWYVTRLGREFSAGGVPHVYAYLDRKVGKLGSSAGGIRGAMCDECGERRAVTTGRDMSGIPGRVCGTCARGGALSFA
jgi:hypothetical protein